VARSVQAVDSSDEAAVLDRLRSTTMSRQLLLVRNIRSFARPGVCRLLLEEAFELRFENPTLAFERATVAVALAERLQASNGRRDFDLHGLRAQAWVGLGNAQRVLNDFRQAEISLAAADRELMRSDSGPAELAWWLDIMASLRSDQSRFDPAERLAEAASVLYRQARDLHAAGRNLIKRGMIRGYVEDWPQAVSFTNDGLRLVDDSRDPLLVSAAWHNLTYALYRAGRHREALAGLARARPLYLRSGNRTTLVRFQWLEGLIATSLGRLEQAEGCLRGVRRQFIELGVAVDAAVASLDLAAVLGRQGRYDEVRCLATEMIAVFESHRVHREALAALILLQQAARRERVTTELLTQLAARLDRTGSSAAVSGG